MTFMKASEFRSIVSATEEQRKALSEIGMVVIDEMLRLKKQGLSDTEVSAQIASGICQATQK